MKNYRDSLAKTFYLFFCLAFFSCRTISFTPVPVTGPAAPVFSNFGSGSDPGTTLTQMSNTSTLFGGQGLPGMYDISAENASFCSPDTGESVSYTECDPTASPVGGGSGSWSSPYLICSVSQLLLIAGSDNDFILTADLDLSSLSTSGTFFGILNFNGFLDGNYHTITGLSIRGSGNQNIGLFSILAGSVRNLNLSNVNLIGTGTIGALAGTATPQANGQMICRCTSSGSVSSGVSGSPLPDSSTAGGLVGALGGSSSYINSHNITYLKSSSSSVTVSMDTSSGQAGGLVGNQNAAGLITQSFSTGSVNGQSIAGGLVGSLNGGAISDAYSSSAVNGGIYAGGLVGFSQTASTVINTYASGTVSGGSSGIGGLIGTLTGTGGFFAVDSYYTDSHINIIGNPVTLDELEEPGTFTNWDFSIVWNIQVGVAPPTLR